ncbi:MAG: Ig-like domain-containing protein [Anaerolineales bacterium]|nr:Ig-like domain-containing protein [Anaerolineales bacterium]
MENAIRWGEMLREFRLKSGCKNRTELSDKLAELGLDDDISPTDIGRYETGERVPKNRYRHMELIRGLVKLGGIKTFEEANKWLALGGQGYLTQEEIKNIFLQNHINIDYPVLKQRVQLIIPDDFYSLSAQSKTKIIDTLAIILSVPPQAIDILRVYAGSTIFDLGLPPEAVQRLRSLLQDNSEQLHLLRIEKVLLEKESDEPETWAVMDGTFYQVNLTQTTTVAGTGNTTIGNVTGNVHFGDSNPIRTSQPTLSKDKANKPPEKTKSVKKRKKRKSGMVKAIIAAVGAAGLLMGCIVLAVAAWYIGLFDQIPGFSAKPVTITVQVTAETDRTIIPRAQAILFANGERYVKPTDDTGTAIFAGIPAPGRANLSLVVEAQGYQIYNLDNLSRPTDGLVKVLLRPQEGNEANVIVLVTNETQEAVSGAKVVLLVEGNTFTQPTDSNGIATFPIVFSQDKVEAQMRVSTPDYETEAQNITLLPDKVQGIRLNPQNKTLEQVVVASSPQENPLAASVPEIELSGTPIELEQQLNGTLAQGATQEYSFAGYMNTPVLFTIQRTEGDLGYWLQILDTTGVEVNRQGNFYNGTKAFPFTPKKNGQHIIRVNNLSGSGSYVLTMSLISGPASERNQVKPLGLDESQNGSLASGAYDKFSFSGFANTPVLFTLQRTSGGLGYWIQILDTTGVEVNRQGNFYDGTKAIPFTPKKEGEYFIQVNGLESFGSYVLTMSLISGPASERNQVKPLGLDESQNGSLAVGAYDEYKFSGSANTPILFILQRTGGSLGYWIKVLDPNKLEMIKYGPYRDGSIPIPFTPKEDGEYILQVIGTENYGNYVVSLGLISDPASERNQVKPLAVDESQNGSLAVGAYDEYKFSGSANTPILFTLQRTGGSLGYWIKVLDPNRLEMIKYGPYGDGIKPIPFTPKEDGEYIFQVIGTAYYGSYVVSLGLISGPASERNQVKPLTVDESQKGSLAVGAYDEYKFSGSANTPILFTLQRTEGELGYWIQIFDAGGAELSKEGTFYKGTNEVSFTPSENGEYVIRVNGYSSFGKYLLNLKNQEE